MQKEEKYPHPPLQIPRNVGYITITQLDSNVSPPLVVGYNGEVTWDQTKPDGTTKKLLDASKLNSLGWKAEISLTEGIKATYNEYLKK
jgi:GDP-L-fucose synthase